MPSEVAPTLAAGSHPPSRDDRVLLATRLAAAAVILVLVLAVWVLYLNPDTTDQNFAWTITPRLTALAMGAGYAMGIYFFLRVLTASRWHPLANGFLPITAFTIFMALATILHADRFHSGAWNFILWSVIYAITPFLVPFLWWRNHQTDPITPAPGERLVPPGIRRGAATIGIVILGLSLVAFLFPNLAIGVFPWKLTPLTARVIAGWGMLPAFGGLVLSREPRWSAWQVLLEAFTVGILFFALALPRGWNDLTLSSPGAWVVLAIIAIALIGGPLFYLSMQTGRISPADSAETRPA